MISTNVKMVSQTVNNMLTVSIWMATLCANAMTVLRKSMVPVETLMNVPCMIHVITFVPIYQEVLNVPAIADIILLIVPSVKTSMNVNMACVEKTHHAQILTAGMNANVTKETMIPMQMTHQQVLKKRRLPVEIPLWYHLALILTNVHSQFLFVATTAFVLTQMKLVLH